MRGFGVQNAEFRVGEGERDGIKIRIMIKIRRDGG
jgi:hypothetical protein